MVYLSSLKSVKSCQKISPNVLFIQSTLRQYTSDSYFMLIKPIFPIMIFPIIILIILIFELQKSMQNFNLYLLQTAFNLLLLLEQLNKIHKICSFIKLNQSQISPQYKFNSENQKIYNFMQPKTKLKNKKSEVSDTMAKSFQSQLQNSFPQNVYQVYGAVCGDGTFTLKHSGSGAGSHHGGIKHKLYILKSQSRQNNISLQQSRQLINKSIQAKNNKQPIKQENIEQDQKQILKDPAKNKKPKKTSLKDYFRTKTKKNNLYDKILQIFQENYKEELQLVLQQINDQVWLILASIADQYEQLLDSQEIIQTFQKNISSNSNLAKKASIVSKNSKSFQKEQNQSFKQFENQVRALNKQNESLKKKIQKMQKDSQNLKQKLQSYKLKQRNYKKLLKVVQKQNPIMVGKIVEQSKIIIKPNLKKQKEVNEIITRSKGKKNSKKQQNMICSVFSSDSSQFEDYDQDRTLKDLVKHL